MSKIIDGKMIAQSLRAELKKEINDLKNKHNSVPGLAVVQIGNVAASSVYVKAKTKSAKEVGIEVIDHHLAEEISEKELLGLVNNLNNQKNVNGILVQLPLPDHINEQVVLDSIHPDKDADGFHPLNVGKLSIASHNDEDLLIPCTPYGCLIMLKGLNINLSGMNAVVVGRSNIVGKPMAQLLLKESCTVTIAHSKTKNLKDVCKNADIVVAAVGRPEMIRGDWIKKGAIVIDVGINRIDAPDRPRGFRLVGDVDYSRADREASARVRDGNMLLVGIDGNSSQPFRQERLAVQQGEEIFPIERRRFVYVGSADYGKIADRVRFAGAMVLDPSIDLNQPFEVLYNTGGRVGEFGTIARTGYQVPPLPLALATGTPVPPELLPEYEDDLTAFQNEGLYASLINDAPWMDVAILLVLLAMVMTAFLKKNAAIRWVTLVFTLVYLGWVDGGFVSVSHITNFVKVGPSMFRSDLPQLLIIVFTLVTTLFWGRVFCSSLCPFGALQDLIAHFMPRHFQKELPASIHDKAIYIKYVLLAFLIVMAFSFTNLSLFQYFEPFGTIFYFSQSLLLWGILAAFILASVFISRFYCRYACPLGAALGVMAFVSPWRIERVPQCDLCKVCEHSCPTGAIRGPKIDFKECVRCDICETKLIARSGVCKHDMETVKVRIKHWDAVGAAN